MKFWFNFANMKDLNTFEYFQIFFRLKIVCQELKERKRKYFIEKIIFNNVNRNFLQ